MGEVRIMIGKFADDHRDIVSPDLPYARGPRRGYPACGVPSSVEGWTLSDSDSRN